MASIILCIRSQCLNLASVSILVSLVSIVAISFVALIDIRRTPAGRFRLLGQRVDPVFAAVVCLNPSNQFVPPKDQTAVLRKFGVRLALPQRREPSPINTWSQNIRFSGGGMTWPQYQSEQSYLSSFHNPLVSILAATQRTKLLLYLVNRPVC